METRGSEDLIISVREQGSILTTNLNIMVTTEPERPNLP